MASPEGSERLMAKKETATTPETREVRLEIEIDAPPEAVWKAVSEADALASWWSLDARVEPGVGGKVWLSWGPECEGEARITVWEPGKRLRTETDFFGGPVPVAQDFIIETRGGKTVLRLVNSGFACGEDWEDEFDAVSRGWTFELRSLRHYVERHDGARRRVAWPRIATTVSYEEAWRRLMSERGLRLLQPAQSLREGDRYEIEAVTGERFTGRVLVVRRPTDFSGTLDQHHDGLLRVLMEGMAGQRWISVWLSDWKGDEAALRAFTERWNAVLNDLFGEEK